MRFGVAIVLMLALWPRLGPAQSAGDQPKIRGTNSKYQQGDWVSYGVTRFVNAIAVGQQYVYFGTTGGITRYDFFANRWDTPFTTSNGLSDNYVTAVAYDASTGFLWCANRSGISYYHPSAERWNNEFKEEIGIPSFDNVVSIGIGTNDIYFLTEGGRWFRGNKFGGGFIAPLTGADSGNGEIAWFGERAYAHPPFALYLMNDGYFFRPEGFVSDYRLREGPVTAAVTDHWGRIWMGTWRFGALKGDIRSETLEMIPFGLYSPRVDAIAIDKNGIWFGGKNTLTGESGLTYWDQRRQRWTYFESQFDAALLSDEIERLVIQGDTLFCATRFGVSLFDLRRHEWSRIPVSFGLAHEMVHDVVPDGKYLWIATEGGLNLLDITTLKTDSIVIVDVAPQALTGVPVWDLEVTDTEVWAATAYGLYLYRLDLQEGRFISHKEGPIGEPVYCLNRFEKELWLGGDGSVYLFNLQKRKWATGPARNRVLRSPVHAIVAGEQAVWAGTDLGVYKFNRKTNDWVLFDRSDGLLDSQVNAIVIDGEYVWFGTPQGVTAFYWNDPHRID